MSNVINFSKLLEKKQVNKEEDAYGLLRKKFGTATASFINELVVELERCHIEEIKEREMLIQMSMEMMSFYQDILECIDIVDIIDKMADDENQFSKIDLCIARIGEIEERTLKFNSIINAGGERSED